MSNGINRNPLFQGLARPKSWFGVDYYHFVYETIVTGIFFIAINNPMALLVAVPLHIVGLILFAYDPYFYQILRVMGQTRIRARASARSWGGAISFSPAVTRWSKNANEK